MLDFQQNNGLSAAFEDERLRHITREISAVMLAQTAESITLEGKAQPSKLVAEATKGADKKYTPSGQVIEGFMRKLNRRDRRRLVGRLLGRNETKFTHLAAPDDARLKLLFDPKAEASVIDRSDIVKRLAPVFAPRKPFQPGDTKAVWQHWHQMVKPILQAVPTPSAQNDDDDGSSTGTSNPPVQQYNFLNFRVHEIICDDDTNEAARDEISIGGVLASSEIDDAVPTPSSNQREELQLTDAGQFRAGDEVTYNPPRVMQSLPLTGTTFPRLFIAGLAMAEIDNGGFADFISELYDAIEVEITAIIVAVGASVGAAIGAGAAAGSLAASIAGPVGAIIGLVVGAIIGLIFGAISAALRDEIFQIADIPLILEGRAAPWNGSRTSPRETAHFADFGGRYRVIYSWQLT